MVYPRTYEYETFCVYSHIEEKIELICHFYHGYGVTYSSQFFHHTLTTPKSERFSNILCNTVCCLDVTRGWQKCGKRGKEVAQFHH